MDISKGGKDDDGDDSMKNGSSANGDSSSHLSLSLSKKQRKARTAFTDHQLQTLEKSFERQKYLSVQDRMELANKLELSDCQVKTWYQNRRTKWKRQTAVGLELLAEAGNYAAFQRLYGGATPYLSAWPYAAAAAAQSPHGATPSAIDIYYRQAAAAAAMQKPSLPTSYRMYPSSIPPGMALPGMPAPPPPGAAPMLSGYYAAAAAAAASAGAQQQQQQPPAASRSPATSQSANSEADCERTSSSSRQRLITPSPPLNPGSPPHRERINEEEDRERDEERDIERERERERERDEDDEEELALEV
ncbi:homeobox protein B-H2 isoform X2 [Drosophila simulans]|uniref:homeobox protein B-H2 isoform X2 n=1 Tax=Drosophila simulans TaxID=7240 RepID=UPI00078ADED4|nr:homeobox protein B-H2 isoform X2 [Drosophila simulans]KMZ10327.1 uncharacterized protein Dsimw501_GD15666 [Drosophila simulans]